MRHVVIPRPYHEAENATVLLIDMTICERQRGHHPNLQGSEKQSGSVSVDNIAFLSCQLTLNTLHTPGDLLPPTALAVRLGATSTKYLSS